ncbi:MAG: hypothetical protein ACK4NS_03200 [Saprospiraceae bacterium]
MTTKTFLRILALLSLSLALFYAALGALIPEVKHRQGFSAAVILFFAGICGGLYAAGVSAARSTNKHAFTNLISLSVFGKMALSLAFLFVYREYAKPEDSWFVGVFLAAYVAYTVFEVWFMSKLARLK